MLNRLATILLVLAASPAFAETGMTVSFEESAPRDRIRVINKTGCDLTGFSLKVALQSSAGGLIFDTTPGGAGVNVAQPFEIERGTTFVSAVTPVGDGDEAVSITFDFLPDKASAVFTLDVDDRLEAGPMGPTMVAGAEIAGATVTLQQSGVDPVVAAFDQFGGLTLRPKICGPSV